MYRILTNNVISNGKTFQGESLLIDDGRIVDRGTDIQKAETIDLRELTVMPGFIDIHVHGGAGHDVMDAGFEALDEISAYKIEGGCTSFCPATITAPMDKTIKAVKNVKAAMDKGVRGAKIIGTFLEGPYINPKYKGAHPEEYIRKINMKEIKKLINAGGGSVVSIAIAPELTGAIPAIKELVKMGVQVRLGHSAATYEEVDAAANAGANITVHTFNQMSPLHHREPGMVGALCTNPNLMGELICDLIHIHPKVCKILAQIKGGRGTILVTDAMAAAGLPDGEYKLGEFTVNVAGGVSRLPDGTLASSTATMSECVRNIHQVVKVPLEEAVQMATATPAKSLGKFDIIGSLDIGKYADIVGVDSNFDVRFVMTNGIVKKTM